MGGSLCVLGIIEIDTEKFSNASFELKQQNTLEEFGYEPHHIGLPKTKITKKFTQGDYTAYKVSMNSNTIREPIYVYWDNFENNGFKGFREVNKGYQKILYFNFYIDKNHTEMHLFTNKENTTLFLKRLKKEKLLKVNPVRFNFKKINELKDMDSAWGVWEDHAGIERKRARFGKNINTIISDAEYQSVTTIYMDYNYDGKLIQLILSADGRISTIDATIGEHDLLVIFNEIKSVLC